MTRALVASPLRSVLRLPMTAALAILLGVGAFSPLRLFASAEQGAHFEAYNPDALVQRRNLLTFSEQLDNAAWTKQGITVTPNASGTLDKIVESALNEIHYAQGGVVSASMGQTVVASARVKAGERTEVQIALANGAMWGGGNPTASFNLATGALTAQASGAFGAAIEPLGNGEYRVSMKATAIGAGTTGLRAIVTTAGFASVYLGDGASGLYVGEAQCELGTLTPYQLVTDWITEYLAAARDSIGMWQDAIGTTPVTAVEQPVGLWMDSRLGLAVGAERYTTPAAANGVAVNGNGTVLLNGDGSFTATCTTAGTYGIFFNALVAVANTAFVARFTANSNPAGRSMFSDLGGKTAGVGVTTGPKVGHFTGTTNASSLAVYVTGGGIGETFTVTLDSLREIAGNHATQGTAGNRATLSARYNHFLASEDFTNGAWLKTGGGVGSVPVVTTVGGIVGPYGDIINVSQAVLALNGGALNADISAVQQAPATFPATSSGTCKVWVRMAAGAARIAARLAATWQAIDLTTAWQQVTLTEAAGSSLQLGLRGSVVAGLSDAATIYITRADLRTSDDAALNIPPYQRVNTATDYDTVSYPHYLKFETDKNLTIANLDLSGTDKLLFYAAVTKLSDAAIGTLIETSADATANNGSFHLLMPNGAATPGYAFRARGTLSAAATIGAGYAAPVSNVITGIVDIAADVTTLRINGAQVATSAADLGAGNFVAQAGYIGRRGGLGLPLNARVYCLGMRGGLNEARFMRGIEQYAARISGQQFVSA